MENNLLKIHVTISAPLSTIKKMGGWVERGGGWGGGGGGYACYEVLRPPTRADRLPFVDASYCKSSLNSSVTSRRSQHGKQKGRNNPRSSYMSSGFIRSRNLRSLRVRLCTYTKLVLGSYHESRIKQLDFVPSGTLTPAQRSVRGEGGGGGYKRRP